MRTLTLGLVLVAALTTSTAGPALAATQTILGKRLQIKDPTGDPVRRRGSISGKERSSPNTIVGNPTTSGATLQVIANGGTDSNQTFNLASSGWTPSGSSGFKFSNRTTGGSVRRVRIRKTGSGNFAIAVLLSGRSGTLSVVPPNPGDDGGLVLTITGGDSYCVAFGGLAGGLEQRDDAGTWQVRNPTVELCPIGGPTTTTTTTTTVGGSTSTTAGGSTSTTTGVTTSTTSTTLGAPCDCCAFQRLTFTTDVPQIDMDPPCGSATPPGCAHGTTAGNACSTNADCDGLSGSVCVGDLDCGGLYTGGGGVEVGLPFVVPDQGSSVTNVIGCASGTYTLGPTSPGETPQITIRNCTDGQAVNTDYGMCVGAPNAGKPCHANGDCTPGTCSANLSGCLFGTPLPLPNATTPATSVCAVNRVAGDASGSGDCGGATQLSLPLNSDLYLTGDLDGNIANGIQACPLCTGSPGSETCSGGPNGGLPCTPGNSDLDGAGGSYPGSHDCPPPAANFLGTLPVPFALTTGTATKVATDTDGGGSQLLTFCGFCRSATPPNNFQNPAVTCTSNAGCTNPSFPRCQQRTDGAFGNGIASTISLTGLAAGCLADGLPHPATLVSAFCIPPTYNGLVDGAGDLPGPGAVALIGEAQLIDMGSTTTSTPGTTTTTTTVVGATTTTTTTAGSTTTTTLILGCGTAPTCAENNCPGGQVCSLVLLDQSGTLGCTCVTGATACTPTSCGGVCPPASGCEENPFTPGQCACVQTGP